MAADYVVTVVVLIGSAVGFAAAFWFATSLARIEVPPTGEDAKRLKHSDHTPLLRDDGSRTSGQKEEWIPDVYHIGKAIADGANAFLFKEYQYVGVFVGLFSVLLFILLGAGKSWALGGFSTLCFIVGAFTSILSGFIGMRAAVFTNVRTAKQAAKGEEQGRSLAVPAGIHGQDAIAYRLAPGFELAFDAAFRGGAIMGFCLTSLGLIVLFILIHVLSSYYDAYTDVEQTKSMYEALSGYGLGGSTIALFGRVGGGIYTKAADVGADLAGKVDAGLREDDPKNPAVIADNVGDNVGDIAGMGADLFGSFAESACATMVISAQSRDLWSNFPAMCFPLLVTGSGLLVCFVTSFVATHLMRVKSHNDVEPTLKRQLMVSTVLMTPVIFAITWSVFPDTFLVGNPGNETTVKHWYIFFTVCCGLWSGLIIGYVTEYYTSHSYSPVREVAQSCVTGAATNIIYGLALGYKSVIIPVFSLAVTIYVSYKLAGMYGIATAALGILSTLATGLTIDAYGPISDNAGGIAEMTGMPPSVRDITDALDAAGNTTAAIGKGFAIGSAALVSLALFGAFVTTVEMSNVDLLDPFVFAGLLVGAMLPYWFSAMTMKSVGDAAQEMVKEVKRQFDAVPRGPDGQKDFTGYKADYSTCVAISTDASLKKMIAPGALVMLSPLIAGFFFGTSALAGLLAGALVSGVQMAISASNTGGAWDNAKKYIEGGNMPPHLKHSDAHKAAVVGDTVGDPLKDTSGPSLNILIKLMAIISLVFAPAMNALNGEGLLTKLFNA